MDISLFTDFLNDIFGVILPIYVINLVLQKTPSRHVKVYSRMLIASCVLDFLYIISNIVSMTTMIFADKKVYFVIRNRYIWFNHTLVTCALVSHIYCIFISIALIPIQFMYRYKVVTSSTASYTIVFWPLLVAASYIAIHHLLLPITFQTTSAKYDKVLQEQGYGIYSGNPYYVADAEVERWLPLHLMNSIFIISMAYIVTYVYYRRTQNYLHRYEESVLPATLKAQKQVGMVLATQALYPMIVLGIPCIIGNLVPILGISSALLGNVLISIVHTTPILNALSIIICVPSYRRATLSLFRGMCRCKFDECKRDSAIHSMSDNETRQRSSTVG